MFEKLKEYKSEILFIICSAVILCFAFNIGVSKHIVKAEKTVVSVSDTTEITTTDSTVSTTVITTETTSVTTTETTTETTTIVQIDDTPGHIEVPNLVPADGSLETVDDEAVLALPPTATEDYDGMCTFTVSCGTILNNMDKLDKAKKSLVPGDGFIYKTAQIGFKEGDTVFDVLEKTLVLNNIHYEYNKTSNVYIEGINNIYEFDCGELSGWMYKVNGEFPNKACDTYKLKDGDVVEWVYTCDLGRDVGDEYIATEPESK